MDKDTNEIKETSGTKPDVSGWLKFSEKSPINNQEVELQFLDGSTEFVTWKRGKPWDPHIEDLPYSWRPACR